MSLEQLLAPKPMEHYAKLTNGGEFKVTITQDEACVALKIHDYGVEALNNDEKTALHSLIAKLKDKIWP